MNFIHKIAAYLYCDLVVFTDVKMAPPSWLFNKPKKKLKHTYSEEILADVNFTIEERWLIEEACRNMEWFSNGFIRLKITFEWEPSWELPEDRVIMLRGETNDNAIIHADGYYKSNVLGLCSWMTNNSIILHIVHERLKNPHTFRTTVLHEIGHYLGMRHTQRPSIMHKSNHTDVLYLTYKDAVEFGKVFNLDPESLRYFKL